MPQLFSQEWFQQFVTQWNQETDLVDALAASDFRSRIGYGFQGETNPQGVIYVDQGSAIHGDIFQNETLDWDLRARPESWKEWLDRPPRLMGLGMAYSNHELEFRIGDYAAIIKNPRLAGPFVKSFAVMAQVGYE